MSIRIRPNSLFRWVIAWFIATALSLSFAQSTSAPQPAMSSQATPDLGDAAVEQRISALLQKMTLEEKLGQLTQFSGGQPTGTGTGHGDYKKMIAAGKIGSLLNVTGARETNELQRVAMTQSRLKIPLLFGLDVIHGYRTIFPVPLGLAATWDTELVERVSATAAHEAAAEGIRWTFSPMVDIARDARWGRIVEGAGEDPYLGSAMAQAYVRGYQGKNLSHPGAIAACAKHFVGYGAAEAGRDYNTTEIPERLLREIYLPPFQAAAEAGAATFMSAFSALNEVPASANSFILTQILRREWGFRGLVVSDWSAVRELMAHGIANDGATAARKALLAGVDMDMESKLYLDALPAQVKSGAVSMAAVDEAVRRVLRVKFALGLFKNPYAPEAGSPPALNTAHLALARAAAEESLVLLKNAQAAAGRPLLPLGGNIRSIALIGPLADSAADMLGPWAAKGDPRDVVTPKAALAEWAAAHGVELRVEKGVDIIGGSDAGISAAVDAARKSGVVLLALGESAGEMTGEAASRAHLDLPGLQQRLLDAVTAAGRPVALILFSGRPLALTPVVEKVSAIVQAWYPGIQAGPALVRVLTGQSNFTAKTTVSFPRSVGQEPTYYNHLNTGRPSLAVDLTRPPRSLEEKYVSRYLDEQNLPLFPFGFGLSYTRFEYSPLLLSSTSLSARRINSGAEALRVQVEMRNAGDHDGVEIVQLYVNQRGTSVARPVRELKGFRRVPLRVGESKRIEFVLGKQELAFWNLEMKKVAEPALVKVWVGPDSASGSSAEFQIVE